MRLAASEYMTAWAMFGAASPMRDENIDDEAGPSSGEAVIDPEDGLFQGMRELEQKLGPAGFLQALFKAFPPKAKVKTDG
jgi:hypothetical protein